MNNKTLPQDIENLIFEYYNPYKKKYNQCVVHIRNNHNDVLRGLYIKSHICYGIIPGNIYENPGGILPSNLYLGYDWATYLNIEDSDPSDLLFNIMHDINKLKKYGAIIPCNIKGQVFKERKSMRQYLEMSELELYLEMNRE